MRRKYIRVVLGGIISLAVMLSVAILPAAPVSANSAVNISLSPASSTVAVGETFSVNITLDAGTQKVMAAAAYINFDPTYLEVQNITRGATLQDPSQDLWIGPSGNNTAGTIDCTWGRYGGVGLPDGTFTLATIYLKALAETSSTPLTFAFESPKRNTDIRAPDLTSILGAHPDGVVTIQPLGILNGHVDLQGRGALPGAPLDVDPQQVWVTPLTVKFFFPNGTIAWTENVTTDDWGNFTIADVASGTYNIGVKCPRSLSELVTGVTFYVANTTAVSFGTLREGDANNDDVITGADYSQLCGDFNENSGPALDRCDFNRDWVVGGADLGLLKGNFNEIGDMYGM